MEIKQSGNNIEICDVEEFDLEKTFECGQCFRWEKNCEKKYTGIVYNKVLTVHSEKDKVILENTSIDDFEKIWRTYFDLDTDYVKIKEDISRIDPVLKEATNFSTGIRILRQEPWETLCSFIISQNNNIPRISGIINRLCEAYGDKIDDNNYSFPTPTVIAKLKEEDLKILRAGFRTGYILDAAHKISSGEVNMQYIERMSLDDAIKELIKIYGVGKKISECTLLYGFHRLDAFPVDVWMKRALKELFCNADRKYFGPYAGIAQQYIFHYSRMNKDLFKN